MSAAAKAAVPERSLKTRFGGVQLGIRHVVGMPVFALRALLAGGAMAEREPGEAWVTGRLLSEGTRRRDWQRLAADLEDRGIACGSAGGLESHGVSMDGLATDWEVALDTLAELLFESRFEDSRCRWIKRQARAELESSGDQPDVKAGWAFLDQLYYPNPAARPAQGTRAGLRRVTSAGCRRFHRAALGRGLVITLAGDVDPDAVADRVAALFSRVGEGKAMVPPPARGRRAARRKIRVRGRAQYHLYAGKRTVERAHPDVPALELLAVILGAGPGFTGRIPARVREAEGLAYHTEVHTVAGAGLGAGRLVVYVGCTPKRVEEAEVAVREELRRLVDDGPTAAEVDEARSYLLGRDSLRRETARQGCDLLAEALFYGEPCDEPNWARDRFAALDCETLAGAARRHLDPEDLKITVGATET